MEIWRKLFPPPGKNQFAAIVCREFRKHPQLGEPEYHPDKFTITLSCGGQSVYLANHYETYIYIPIRDRRAYLRFVGQSAINVLAALGAAPPDYGAIRRSLLPKVRPRSWQSIENLRNEVDGQRLVDFTSRLLCEDLALEMIIDTPTDLQFVTESKLGDWGESFDAAMADAKENLWRISNEEFQSISPGYHLSPWRDNHDASRLVLHDLIWQLKVKGDHVAAIPNRDRLIVTGSEDVEGLVALARQIEEETRVPRFMTAGVFRLNGTHWESWLPPVGHPAYEPLRSMRLKDMAHDYAEQTELLEKLHQNTGRDVYVAPCVVEQWEGRLVSRSTWSAGIDTLMPTVEWLTIAELDQQWTPQFLGIAPWEGLMKTAPHLFLKDPTLFPIRYLLTEIPTPEQRGLAGMISVKEWAENQKRGSMKKI